MLFKHEAKDRVHLVFRDDKMQVWPIEVRNAEGRVCYSYVCQPNQARGAFQPKKAKAIKGLVPKLHYKALTDGQSVTLEDGTIVEPSQVCEDPAPSQCFAFIFMEDSSYVDGFMKAYEDGCMLADFAAPDADKQLVTFYHSVPYEVIMDERYTKFMIDNFGNSVKHILDCPESNLPCLAKSKAAHFTERIKMICPRLFPMAETRERIDASCSEADQMYAKIADKFKDMARSQSGLTYDLFPLKSQKMHYGDPTVKDEAKKRADDLKAEDNTKKMFLEKVHASIEEKSSGNAEFKEFFEKNMDMLNNRGGSPYFGTSEESTDEPQIFFLGTASMKPGQYRGASAIYFFNRGHGILMDCAEGSYGQLCDHFGTPAAVAECLLRTKVVFITHIHGDHQLGILKLMRERDLLITEEHAGGKNILYVVTPSPMMEWMQAYVDDQIRDKSNVKLIPSKYFNPEQCYYYQ